MSERIPVTAESVSPNTGYILDKKAPNNTIEVSRTDENNHFFVFNKARQRYELAYQGSQLIIDLLLLLKENEEINPSAFINNLPLERHLAFFDTNGNFYNFVLLDKLIFDHQKEGKSKSDLAIFSVYDQTSDSYSKLEMPVPEIYCISLAAHPFIWEGDGNN